MVELNLTKRQQEIFDFIKRYSAKYGYPPTVRDIGKAVGLASSSTVHAHLVGEVVRPPFPTADTSKTCEPRDRSVRDQRRPPQGLGRPPSSEQR